MKKKYIVLLCFLILFSLVFALFSINKTEKKTVYGIKSESNINLNRNSNSDNLKHLNQCSTYIKDYFFNSLPNDSNSLSIIRDNIANVIEKDIFYLNFKESDFQNILLRDPSYYKNNGYYDESYLQKRYYAQLLSIKLKIDLILGDYTTFSDYFIYNYNTLSIALPYYFCSYLSEEPLISKDEEKIDVVVETYEKLLILCEHEMDTYDILSDMFRLTYIETLASEKKIHISTNFQEILQSKNIQSVLEDPQKVLNGLETTTLNPDKEYIFSYVASV